MQPISVLWVVYILQNTKGLLICKPLKNNQMLQNWIKYLLKFGSMAFVMVFNRLFFFSCTTGPEVCRGIFYTKCLEMSHSILQSQGRRGTCLNRLGLSLGYRGTAWVHSSCWGSGYFCTSSGTDEQVTSNQSIPGSLLIILLAREFICFYQKSEKELNILCLICNMKFWKKKFIFFHLITSLHAFTVIRHQMQ